MLIAPNVLNLLKSLSNNSLKSRIKNEQNNDLAEYWREVEQKVREQNNGAADLLQFFRNESARNDRLRSEEGLRQVKFNYD